MRVKRELSEREKFASAQRRKKAVIRSTQAAVLIAFTALWETASDYGWIDPFLVSSPQRVARTILGLAKAGDLFRHVAVTMSETLAGFLAGSAGGILIGSLLWCFPTLARICDPYLVVLNAIPKVALGPLILVWAGMGAPSIIILTLAISMISTVITVQAGFAACDAEKITLMKSFGARKTAVLFKVVMPSSYSNIISALKINVSLSWVGVIMGEFLVSKAGLGYLIMYGSQVFKMDLLMAGVVLVSVCAAALYFLVAALEALTRRRFGGQ